MARRREMRELIRQVEACGRTKSVRISGGGHWRLEHVDGTVAFIPHSPSDGRSLPNARSMLRRLGFLDR